MYRNITFSDSNSPGSYDITLAEIVATSNRTKTIRTMVTSYNNVQDTFTSIGGKLKVYDKRKVGTGDSAYETSLDLVTINEGYQNQVSIDTVDGVVISHQGNDNSATTAAMNEEGIFAGGKNYDTAKAYMKNEDGSLMAADGTFTVEKKTPSNGDDYAEATLKSKHDNYLISLKAANGGGIEVKGKDGGNAKYDMAKLGTNGIIYSTKGLILGGETVNGKWTYADADSATFYVNADNGNVTAKGTLSVAGGEFKVDANGASFTKDGKTTTIAGDTVITGDKSFKLSDIADVSSRIGDVETSITDVKNSVDSVKQDVTNLGNRIGNVETSISDVKNSVNSVKQDVTNLGNRIEDVNTNLGNRIGNVETSISEVKNSVDNAKQDVTNLGNRIGNVETSITDVKNSVDSVKQDVTNVSNNLGQIDDLNDELKCRPEYKNGETVVGGINAEAAVRRNEIARLDNRINDVDNRLNKVGAMAAVIAALKTMGYDPENPTEVSIGLGQYKGETGMALGFFHYPNKNFMLNLSVSTAGGETMGSVGATWHFGNKTKKRSAEEQNKN